MSGLKSLLWREWREARGVILGCGLVAIVATLLCQQFVFKWDSPQWTGQMLVPYTLALVSLILASDLISNDIKTRRIESLAMLPVPLSRVLAAKLIFLIGTIVLFAVAIISLQCGLLALTAHGAWAAKFANGLVDARFVLGWTLLVTSGVLFFSCLALRSFVAALLGAALAAAVGGIGLWFDLEAVYGLRESHFWWMGAGVATLFVVSGVCAFLRGPAQAASGRRVRAVGFGVLLAVLVPVTSGVAWAVHAHFQLEPGDPLARIHEVMPSVDGRSVAIQLLRSLPADDSARGRERAAGSEGFVYDVTSGKLVYRSGRRTYVRGWDEHGALAVSQQGFSGSSFGSGERSVFVDPRNGDRLREMDAKAARGQLSRRWPGTPRWYKQEFLRTPKRKRPLCRISMKHGSPDEGVLAERWIAPSQEPGQLVLVDENGAVAFHDLKAGTSRVLVSEPNEWIIVSWALSPSERYVVALGKDESVVVEIATGKVVVHKSHAPERRHGAYWVRSGTERDLLAVHFSGTAAEPTRVVEVRDLTSGVSFDIEKFGDASGIRHVESLADGRVVLAGDRRVDVFRADGTFERTLYAARKGEDR